MIVGEWNLNYRSPKAEGKVSKQLNELQPRAKSVAISSNSYTDGFWEIIQCHLQWMFTHGQRALTVANRTTFQYDDAPSECFLDHPNQAFLNRSFDL